MRKHIPRIAAGLAATLVTGLAIALAWVSAQQRATTESDRLLTACVWVVFASGVHMLPVLRHRVLQLVLWPVWLLCFSLAGYGHASWFYLSAESAAEAREAGSAAVVAAARERAAIEKTLSTIKARPVAQVARQLSLTSDPDRRAALADELAEARRAAGLRDRLVMVSGYTPGTSGVHPSTREVHPSTGASTVTSTGVTLVMSVAAALLIEVLGALLWSVALGGDDDEKDRAPARAEPVQHVVQQMVNVLAPIMSRPAQVSAVEVVDDLAELRAAVARGECKPSVRGIREDMCVGSARAAQIRQQLIDH